MDLRKIRKKVVVETQQIAKPVESTTKTVKETNTTIITKNSENKAKISKEEALKEIKNKCFDIGNKNQRNILYHSITYKKIDYVSSIKQLEKLIFKDYPVLKKFDMKTKKYYLDVEEDFFEILFFENKITDVIEEVNLFQKEEVIIEKVDKILYITTNNMQHRQPKKIEVDEQLKNEIINDYKEHFQQLDEVLLFNVACRFSNSRRQSYLHLRLRAGFGKSFLKSIFLDLGLWNEIKYSDIKSPTGLRPSQFKNSIGTVLDEFTVFKQEFKDWTNKISVEAKGASNIYVPIFAKIFLSAEVSKSFINGVNEQISDRVSVINIDNKKITDRKLYKENEALYYNVVLNYVNDFVKEKIKYFQSLDFLESNKEAGKILSDFYNKNKLESEDLDTTIYKYFYQKIYELYDTDEYDLKGLDLDIRKNIIVSNNFIYIKQPKKTFELVIKSGDEDFYKKSRFRATQFEQILKTEVKVNKINKKSTLSMKISLDFLKKVMEEIEEDHEEIPF